MTQDELQRAVKKLLTELRKRFGADAAAPDAPACPDHVEPIVHELMFSFMLWNASAEKASAAVEKLLASAVDLNELRVCFVPELVQAIGPRYPDAESRCEALRRVLNAIWAAEHAVTLDHLGGLAKRAARTYLDGLDGMIPFVAARLALVRLGAHAAPLDDRLVGALVDHGVLDEPEPAAELSPKLERAVRADDALALYALLEAAAAAGPAKRPTKKTSPKAARSGSKKAPKRSRKATGSSGRSGGGSA